MRLRANTHCGRVYKEKVRAKKKALLSYDLGGKADTYFLKTKRRLRERVKWLLYLRMILEACKR
jgi:hypothetical protein